jgi:hypothetical protein
MSENPLQHLIELAGTFLDVFPGCTRGEEATQAIVEYVDKRTQIFAQLEANGGLSDGGIDSAKELLAQDEKVRRMLVHGAQGVEDEMERLRNGRRALRGYKAGGGASHRPLAVKG